MGIQGFTLKFPVSLGFRWVPLPSVDSLAACGLSESQFSNDSAVSLKSPCVCMATWFLQYFLNETYTHKPNQFFMRLL